MRKKSDMRKKQLGCVDFTYRADETMIMADVGTGKTVIALTVLQEWLAEGIVTRAMVLGTKRICRNVWHQEIADWEHLKGMSVANVAGLSVKKRRAIIEGDAPIVAVNYEVLSWLIETYPNGPPGFNCLWLDEIDKLKDHTTRRFKGAKWRDKKANAFCEVEGLNTYRRHFEIIVGMTGTPAPKNLLNLWAQAFIIDGGKRLGDNYYKYREKYFYQNDYSGYKFAVLPGMEDVIYSKLAGLTYRIEQDAEIPQIYETPVRYVEMPADVRKQYKQMERNYILHFTKDKSIEADNAGVVYGKLRQMASGFLYREDKTALWLTQAKYAELDDLISELQGKQLMVIYHFVEQLAELKRRYPDMKYLGGGISDKEADQAIAEWNDGTLGLLGLHPDSGGHGINMQFSSANHIAVLTMPETAGLYTQVIGRLARSGSDARQVFVHRIMMRHTIDEDRMDVVAGEVKSQKQLLDAMRARSGE